MARRSGGDAALACAIRALRLAANLAPLYRRGIDGEINDLCMGGGDIRAFVDGKVARWYDVVAWYGRPVLNLRNWLTRGDVQLDSAAREVTRDGSAISPLELRADLTLRDDERHANLLRAILARAI